MSRNDDERASAPRLAGCRWWPAAAVAAIWAASVTAAWAAPALMRQEKVLATLAVSILSIALLFLWAVLFSRFARRTRAAIFLAAAAAAAAIAATVRIEGVSGDFVPRLAFRWDLDPDRSLPAPPEIEIAPADTGAARSDAGLAPGSSSAALHDFPQFLGPERRCVVRGVRLDRDWEARPPRLVWRRPIGAGWSSFAIAGERAYTQEQRGEDECVSCYDLETGEVIWIHADRERYSSVIAGDGPRATPSVVGDRVYAVGSTGILNCLDRATGERLWTRRIVEENGAEVPEWGTSCSPLVAGGRVIVSAGGREGRSMAAYDAMSGEPIWRGGSGRSGYSSPVEATLAGRRQLLILNHASVAAHDFEDGTVLWDFPWPDDRPNVAQPLVVAPDRVLVSSGYGVGCALLEVVAGAEGALSVRPVWRNRNLKAKFSNFIVRDGFVYGLDDGILVCIDLEDGSRRWKGGRYGHGQMLLVDDTLLVTSEFGDVALIDPSPESLREVARLEALEGRTWPCPALSGARLIVRSQREAACWELPIADPPSEAGRPAQRAAGRAPPASGPGER